MRVPAKTSTWHRVFALDKFLDYHAPLLFLLLAVFLLRLPNYFEPYWYGDEGIYLTIGKALNQGRELYAEIIDHKTPLIYFFAQVSEQLHFRLLMTAWMLISTALFYALSLAFFRGRLSATVATLVFVLFTTLPWFEGNIPNGELFVMGFVLLGGVLLIKSNLFQRFLNPEVELPKSIPHKKYLFLAGLSFGLAILTKVPGLFDLVAFMTIGVLTLTNELTFSPKQNKTFKKLFESVVIQLSLIFAGAITAIAGSVLYFYSRGTHQAYLEYGLLYNFRYAGNWGLPFDHPLLIAAFSLPGKFLIATGIVILAILLRRFLRPVHQFALSWFALALFASLLSNRPYPHYFLQVIPPLALLIGAGAQRGQALLKQAFSSRSATSSQAQIRSAVAIKNSSIFCALLAGAIGTFVAVLLLLNVGMYPTASYYSNWWKLVSGQQNTAEYYASFNYLMTDNYAAAPILSTAKDRIIFIWGTNPVLYALSDTIPAGRFTVSFHIADFDAYDETMASIKATEPEYIVIMRDEQYSFPELQKYVATNYVENSSFDHFSIWRRRSF